MLPIPILVENNNNCLEQSNYYSTSFDTLTMHSTPTNSSVSNGHLNHQTIISSTSPTTNMAWGSTTVTPNSVHMNNQELLKPIQTTPGSQAQEGIGNKGLIILPTQPTAHLHHSSNLNLHPPGSMPVGLEHNTFNHQHHHQSLPPPPPLMPVSYTHLTLPTICSV